MERRVSRALRVVIVVMRQITVHLRIHVLHVLLVKSGVRRVRTPPSRTGAARRVQNASQIQSVQMEKRARRLEHVPRVRRHH